MIKSWKTTIGGLLMALGTMMMQTTDPLLHSIGVVCNAIGGLFLGFSAKDNNVTGGTVHQ
jgi:hypothetical protein